MLEQNGKIIERQIWILNIMQTMLQINVRGAYDYHWAQEDVVLLPRYEKR